MNEDHLERMLKNARLPNMEMNGNRRALRAVLARAVSASAANEQRTGRRSFLKPFFAVGVIIGSILGAVFVLLIKDADASRRVADNLGSIWCTYTDNRGDGGAVIWPPSSPSGQNNFVKSAPGYGGKGYAVRFKGKIDGTDSLGFIGVSTFLGPQCFDGRCSGVDIRKYEKIRFKMKGRISGGDLLLLISSRDQEADSDRAATSCESSYDYESKITEFLTDDWHTVTLDLRADFSRASAPATAAVRRIEDVLSDTRQVKWHVRGEGNASVDVWIDNLEFY
jgi:hypothetical protein